jgi:Do/DeqQ family serine protease
MNFPLRSLVTLGLACLVVAAAPAQVTRAEKKAPAPTAPNPRPVVRVDNTPLGTMPALVTSYADIVEPVQRAVVSIDSTKIITERTNPLLRQLFPGLGPESKDEQKGLGSGVIVSADGYILTNHHVVAEASVLQVQLADDREYTARLIGSDPKTDIAVIKIDDVNLPAVTLADSEKVRVGDVVFAVGNPLGVGQTVTMGIVSARNRNVKILQDVGGYEDFIQTDAAINMGNSGGALIDARGRLIGINSAILSPSRGSIGIGFAIPVNLAASIMHSLIETGSVARGYLGVVMDNVTADVAEQLNLPRETRGALVTNIEPRTPAEKAGVKRLDIITGLNDHRITRYEELRLLISQIPPGGVARLKVLRDGKERRLDVTLEKFADQPDEPPALPAEELFPGVSVRTYAVEDRRRLGIFDAGVTGLLVTDVAENSPYRRVIAPDTVIVEIRGKSVTDVASARTLLRPGRNLLTVYSGGAFRIFFLDLRP